jgi:hypothetical protein
VNWGKRGPGGGGQLLGQFGTKASPTTVDVWEQQGIYLLLHDWRVVYVGKAISMALGARLRNHLSDRLAGRWDRFSWYGIRTVRITGELGTPVANKQASAEDLVATFEALLVVATSPPLNRQGPTIPRARKVDQHGAERPRPVASYLEELRAGIQAIQTRVDELGDG